MSRETLIIIIAAAIVVVAVLIPTKSRRLIFGLGAAALALAYALIFGRKDSEPEPDLEIGIEPDTKDDERRERDETINDIDDRVADHAYDVGGGVESERVDKLRRWLAGDGDES